MLGYSRGATRTVECDVCGDILETDTKDFYEAIQIAKREDWLIRKIDNEWTHTCPDCAEDEVV